MIPVQKLIRSLLSAVLTAAILAALSAPAAIGAELPASKALPADRSVCVDGGATVTVAAYTVGDYDYYRLRDLSSLLRGTRGRFAVSYDARSGSVAVKTGADGPKQDFTGSSEPRPEAAARPSTLSVTLDGRPVALAAYLIADYTYVRLRDAAALLGVRLDYDAGTKTALLYTAGAGGAADANRSADYAAGQGDSADTDAIGADSVFAFVKIQDGVLTLKTEAKARIARIEMTSGARTAECESFRTPDSRSEVVYGGNGVMAGYTFEPGRIECVFTLPAGFAPEEVLIYETLEGKPLVYDIAAGEWGRAD